MAIESTQVLSLVRATGQDQTNFIDEWASRLEQSALERIKTDFSAPMDGIFLIRDPATAIAQGYVLLKPYDRLDHAVEMIPWLDQVPSGSGVYLEVLRDMVDIVSQNLAVEFIVLKIEENKRELIQSAESLGFLKEGIYISNQFLKGEFSFYSVYMYKLS